MMKTSVLRQARFCRVALSTASRVQIASRPFPTASPLLSSIPRAIAIPCRSASSPLLRLYSSEADAHSQDDRPDTSGRITKFRALTELGVHPNLVGSIVNGLKYESMTEVQSLTINAALDGKDLVAQAKTGTGKTLAFLVPLVQRILSQEPDLANRSRGQVRARSDDIRAIIVSPTRELAEQIATEAERLTNGTSIKVQCAVGGTHKNSMLRKTHYEGCHLLVGTPGRLRDLLSDEYSKIAAPNLQALVLDEADRMLEQGFEDELQGIINALPNRRDVPRQTLLFSATIPKNVVSLARTYINEENFDFVQTVNPNDVQTHERVPQYIVPCKGFENTYPTLLELIERMSSKAAADPDAPPFKAIVFLPTTASVVFLSSIFKRIAYHNRSMPPILDIHSKLTQASRTRSAEQFRKARSAILFSSDVTARGMDFPNVSHVIQLHLPNERESYIHRVGRTGRAGKGGEGWLIISDLEVPLARRRLDGLPIKRATDLVCAAVDAESEAAELPRQFSDIQTAIQKLPEELNSDAYRSLLGGALAGQDKQQVVDECNKMAIHGWGLREIPGVSFSVARNLGVRGLRVWDAPREHAPAHGRTVGRGFPTRGDRSGGDRFDRMFGSNERHGSGDRGRGFGQSRGGGYQRPPQDRGDRGDSWRDGGDQRRSSDRRSSWNDGGAY